MKVSWRTELPQLVVLAAMFVVAAVMWDDAPSRIPLHWNAAGEVDRYGGKFEGLLGLPLIARAVYALQLVLPRVDPARANYAQFRGAYVLIRISTIVLFGCLYFVIVLWMQGVGVDMRRFVPIAVGGLLVVAGSVMGKIRPNWFVGIRTPWTLSSKLSWVKTHRMGGWAMVLIGLALMLTGALWPGPLPSALIGALAAVVGVWVILYSYLVWRRDPEKLPAIGTRPGS